MRSITERFTPMVAFEAFDFGCPKSPLQNRSSIVMASWWMSFHRRPASSEIRSPV